MSGSARRLAVTVVFALSSWSCGSTEPVPTQEVAAVVVSPSTSTLVPDAQLPLRALVQDGSGEIVTDAEVTWTVQDPRIVSVSAAGVVKALAVGTSQVAANALGKSGIAVITVAPASTASPADPGDDDPGAPPVDHDSGGGASGDDDASGENGGGGDPADGESGDGDSGSGGQAGNGDAGTVATVTVTAPSQELETGSTMQLTATAKDGAGNAVPLQNFIWSSSNTDKATVSTSGVVTAKEQGSVTITAQTSSTNGKSGSVRIQIRKK